MSIGNIEAIGDEKRIMELLELGFQLHYGAESAYIGINDEILYAAKTKKGLVSVDMKLSNHDGEFTSQIIVATGKSRKNDKKYYDCNQGVKITYAGSSYFNDGSVIIEELGVVPRGDWHEGALKAIRGNAGKFGELPKEEQIAKFVQAMEIIGYKKNDVLAVLDGTMTAEMAYQNMVPKDRAHIRKVFHGWRMFEFHGNTMVSGRLNDVHLDYLAIPPFDGSVYIDCSKVEIPGEVYIGENKKGLSLSI